MAIITLVKTCGACPEQYDAFIGEEKVGYLRLRHGHFTADCPPHLVTVYQARPSGDGIFMEDERDGHLDAACRAILAALGESADSHSYEIKEEVCQQ